MQHGALSRWRVSLPTLLIVTVLWIPLMGSPTACAGEPGAKAIYVGGSLPGLPDSAKGRIHTTETDAFRFTAKDLDAEIPWERINLLEYGQRVGRRLGMAILVSPLFLMAKTRKHFLTVSYVDERERQQALVFQLDKDHVRSVLVSMEARTGLRVEFQDNEARFGGESQ
jgi:hypothetical protein